jgi:hypothetical protein
MKQAFALTVILIGVLAAMFFLKRKATDAIPDGGVPAAPPQHTTAPADGAPADGGAGSGMRIIALTRLVPSYTVILSTPDAAAARAEVLEGLRARGASVVGALPADPRASFRAAVPESAFKPLLRNLGLGKRKLRLKNRPARPTPAGPATIDVEFELPAP